MPKLLVALAAALLIAFATGVLAALLFGGVFAENVVWIVTGIAMIALALLDAAYFILGRRKEEG